MELIHYEPLVILWSCIRRARCLFQGAITDDIDICSRTHEINRDNDNVEGFGFRWDDEGHHNAAGLAAAPTFNAMAANRSRTVSFKPLMGLFNQPKYLPLMWGGIVMEFEFVTNSTECIGDWGGGGSSTQWEINDVKAICDVVILDSALQNSYAEHVLSGKALPSNYSTYITLLQSV